MSKAKIKNRLNHDSSDLHDDHDSTQKNQSNHMNQKNHSSDKWEIPSDWEVKELDEVVEFLDGKRKPIKDSDRAKIHGIYPYYGASGIIDYVNDFIFDEELILLGEDGANIINRSSPLAFTVKGKIWVNNHAHVLRPKKGFAIGYITEFLESIKYDKYNTGTAQPKLNKEVCSSIPILCPPLPEQTAIAQLLSTWDNAITNTQALITQKEQRKKWLMQNLLTGKMRLKINDELKIDNGELNNRSLTDLILGELGKIVSGGTPSTTDEKFWDGKINWVTPTEITGLKGEKYLFKTKRKITEAGLKNSSAEIIPENSILITTRATIGELAINKVPVTTNQGFKSIIPDLSKINTEYLFYLLQTQKQQLKSFATGSTFFEISRADIINFPLSIINSLSEQTAIAQVLQAADKEIQLLKRKCDKLKEQKKGLMQVLLTGKKRLII